MATSKKEKHTTFRMRGLTESDRMLIRAELDKTWAEGYEGRRALREELRNQLGYARSSYTVWQYGTGFPGSGPGEVRLPTHAEELANKNILITDYGNHRVIEVNRNREIVWQYGTTGVAGAAAGQLSYPYRSHRLVDGNTLISDFGNYQLIIVNPGGQIVWGHKTWDKRPRGLDAYHPYDAIFVDANHILVCETDSGAYPTNDPLMWGRVEKITYPAGGKVWEREEASHGPVGLFKIPKVPWDVSLGGGDYLVADTFTRLFELRDSDQAITWTYGVKAEPGHAWNRLRYWCSYGFIWGSDPNFAPVLITDTDASRIIALDRNSNVIWQFGGGSINSRRQSSLLMQSPDYVSPTMLGNLLISESSSCKVTEIIPIDYPVPWEDFNLLTGYTTTNAWVDSLINEVAFFSTKNVQIFNTGANSLDWRVLASQDRALWCTVKLAAALVGGGSDYFIVTAPWRFLKIQVQSTVAGTPTTVTAYTACENR